MPAAGVRIPDKIAQTAASTSRGLRIGHVESRPGNTPYRAVAPRLAGEWTMTPRGATRRPANRRTRRQGCLFWLSFGQFPHRDVVRVEGI
jgi:hypothetical protein